MSHLNPLRVKGRSDASPSGNKGYLKGYPWSSYIDYTTEQRRHPFLALSEILGYFSGNKKSYKHIEPERVLQITAESFQLASGELLRKGSKGIARSMAMELLYRHGGMNGRETGDLMGVDYSAVSVARKRLRASLASDKNVLRLMKKIEDHLSRG